jgi:hypothetical protein
MGPGQRFQTAPAAVDREAGLLVKDQEIGVFVDDPQGPAPRPREDPFRGPPRYPALRGAPFPDPGGEAYRLPGGDAEITAPAASVHQNPAFPQQPVDQGKRKFRQGLSQNPVQAAALVIRGGG